VVDPGAAEFSRRRRAVFWSVRRKSAEKFGLAASVTEGKKLAAVFGGGVEMSWLEIMFAFDEITIFTISPPLIVEFRK